MEKVMTKEEAQQKVCPFISSQHGPSVAFDDRGTVTRDVVGFAEYYCVTTGCMAWIEPSPDGCYCAALRKW